MPGEAVPNSEVVADNAIAFREATDGSIEVTLIRAGISGNRNFYPDATLRVAASLFEGVRVFVKSDEEHTAGKGKAVQNLIGGIYGVRFVEGQGADCGSLIGTFRPIDPSDAVVTKMTEAVKRGMANLMGLSIDAVAKTTTRMQGATRLREASRFTKVNSVDLIVEPGAGGRLDRLTEAAADIAPAHAAASAPASAASSSSTTALQPIPPTGDPMPLWKQRLLEAIKAKDAAKHAAINLDTIGDDDLVRLHESICGEPAAAPAAAKAPAPAPAPAPATSAPSAVPVPAPAAAAASQAGDPTAQRMVESQGSENEDDAPVTRAEMAMIALRQKAASRIAGTKLPQIAKDKLQARIDSLSRFTEAELEAAISEESAYLARLTESGSVRVPSFGTPSNGSGRIEVVDRSVVVTDMLNAFFDPSHKDHRRVHSFRECYVEITGDRNVTGELRHCDVSRLRESLGADDGAFRESILSSTFANALGDAITRRMQAIYFGMTELDDWKRVCTWGPVNDFRTQHRIRIGGYSNLPTVAQGASYAALSSPGDEEATYAVAKRGGTEDVTLEAITNDDVQAIRRIPQELALSAKNTLYEFVFDFFRTNPVIYDTVALFHASHNNLFVAPFSAAEVSAHRLAMLKQNRFGSGKRLVTAPRSLLVPFELQEVAINLFNRNTNLDKTFQQTLNMDVIAPSYWTDANDWCTLADPARLPVLEIGFLAGREEPELFVQDQANVGSLFSNDKVTYKIRHIYGGNVLVDGFKGVTKAVVP
jgi:hypothetical protein